MIGHFWTMSNLQEKNGTYKHHIKALDRDENGVFRKIGLCTDCHVWHEKYINALKTFGYDPEK